MTEQFELCSTKHASNNSVKKKKTCKQQRARIGIHGSVSGHSGPTRYRSSTLSMSTSARETIAESSRFGGPGMEQEQGHHGTKWLGTNSRAHLGEMLLRRRQAPHCYPHHRQEETSLPSMSSESEILQDLALPVLLKHRLELRLAPRPEKIFNPTTTASCSKAASALASLPSTCSHQELHMRLTDQTRMIGKDEGILTGYIIEDEAALVTRKNDGVLACLRRDEHLYALKKSNKEGIHITA